VSAPTVRDGDVRPLVAWLLASMALLTDDNVAQGALAFRLCTPVEFYTVVVALVSETNRIDRERGNRNMRTTLQKWNQKLVKFFDFDDACRRFHEVGESQKRVWRQLSIARTAAF
jgi:hypothetical protein